MKARAIETLAKKNMVYTSNYANKGKDAMVRVRISMSAPQGATYDEYWPTVAPGWNDLLGPYKRGEIDDAEYTKRYLGILERNRKKVLEEFRNLVEKYPNRSVVLLCWCGKGKFCHRRLLAEWLEKNGAQTIREL